MSIISGQTITLLSKVKTGEDGFHRPVYSESEIDVDNVLIAPVSDSETLEAFNLTGHKDVYQLAIPKGDTNVWTGNRVMFWNMTLRVVGEPIQGMEHLIPLDWNMKVLVEKYE